MGEYGPSINVLGHGFGHYNRSNDPRTFITEGRGNEGSKIIAAFIGLVVSPTGLKSIYYLLSHFELHLFFP